jgi:hypothetical protein
MTTNPADQIQSEEIQKTHAVLRPMPYPYIQGMNLLADIQLAKLMPDGSVKRLTLNTIDSNNVMWICTDIKGWWDLPNADTPDIQRGLDDGSYDVRGRWSARDLTLEGSILPPSSNYTPNARQSLVDSLDLVYDGGWLFVKESPVKAAYVRLVGKPEITNVNARGRINFSVTLRASDPIKYDWFDPTNQNTLTWPPPLNVVYKTGTKTINMDSSTVGYQTASVNTDGTTSTTVTNAGNTPVASIIKITGPMLQPATLVNVTTGDRIKIIKDLRAGSSDPTYSASAYSSSSITNKVCTNGVATLSISSHNFLAGDVVTITGITGYNQTGVTLTSVSTGAISYSNPLGSITGITKVSSNVYDVTFSAAHGVTVTGTLFYISKSTNPLFEGPHTVSSVPTTTSLRFSMTSSTSGATSGGSASLELAVTNNSSGAVTLVNTDTIEIDTYNTTTLFRGLADAARSTLDTDITWMKLRAGANVFTFAHSSGSSVTPRVTMKYRSGWIG